MKTYDVIIAGAGISGLLIASELSQKYSVLILEKNEDLPSSKYWLTTKKCLDQNPELISCVDRYHEKMQFITYDIKSYSVQGNYILWHVDKLIDFLKKKILHYNGNILYKYRVYSFTQEPSSIIIHANASRFRAKLFIDSMGFSSPLISATRVVKNVGYYIMYGATIKLKNPIDPICLANVLIAKNPHYLEVFPKSDGYAYTALLKPVLKVHSYDDMKRDFDFIVNRSFYSNYFEKELVKREINGIVPVGILKKRALDRILFFGESAQMNPSATGTCLTRLLLNYKFISKFLSESIEQNKLSGKHLENYPATLNTFSQKFQMNMYKSILNWNSDDFSKFIELINYVNDETVNDFLFNEINVNDFIRRNALKSRNLLWLWPLLKSII